MSFKERCEARRSKPQKINKRSKKLVLKTQKRRKMLAHKLLKSLGLADSTKLAQRSMKCVLCEPEAYPDSFSNRKKVDQIVGICVKHMT